MGLPYPNPKWLDPPAGTTAVNGGWEYAQPVTLPVFSSPIPTTTAEYILTQDWMQLRNNFAPLALNTPHPDYSSFVLVNESDRLDQGAGVVKWTRTYAAKPASYSLPESFNVSYIGFGGVFGQSVDQPTGRPRFTFKVQTRLLYEFFLVGPTIGGGPTSDYTSMLNIPIIQAQKWLIKDGSNFWFFDVDALLDSPPFLRATEPTRSYYLEWVANAINLGWNSDVITYTWGIPGAIAIVASTGAHPGQFAVEDSTISLWRGNIYQRVTRYALAR